LYIVSQEEVCQLDVCLVCCEADSISKDAHTYKGITQKVLRHSADFQAEEDVSFIKNNKGYTMARIKVKISENELSHPTDGEAW
jgi:hypothetical protein